MDSTSTSPRSSSGPLRQMKHTFSDSVSPVRLVAESEAFILNRGMKQVPKPTELSALNRMARGGNTSFQDAERNALELLVIAAVIVLFWVGVWGLTEEAIDELHERFRISKMKIYLGLIILIVTLFLMFPHILDRV